MSLLHTFLPLLLLHPLIGAQAGSPSGQSQQAKLSAQALGSMERDLVKARATDQPGMGLEYSILKPVEVIPALFGEGPNQAWERNIAGLELRLTHVNRRQLEPLDAARFDALQAALLVERILIDTLSSERWHAIGFSKRVEGALRKLSQAPPSAQGYQVQSSILEQLPNYWQASERSLISPQLEWNLMGADHLALTNELILGLRDRDVGQFFDQDTQLRWKAIIDQAADSGASFEAWLRTPPSRAGNGPTRLGPERWLRLAQAASGSRLELSKLKWRVLGFLAQAEQDHGKSWRPDPEAEPAASLERPLQHVNSVSAAARRFLRSAEVLGDAVLPTLEARFQTRDVKLGPLQSVTALRREDPLLLFFDPELATASRAELTALALREVLPQTWFPSERAVQQTRAIAGGWGLYVLDWPLRIDWVENELSAIPGLQDAIAHLQVIEAARLLAAIELHTEAFSSIEATELFLQRTALPLSRARREIQAATLDPLHGIGFLLFLELRSLERSLGADQEAIRTTLLLSRTRPGLRPKDIQTAIGLEPKSKR